MPPRWRMVATVIVLTAAAFWAGLGAAEFAQGHGAGLLIGNGLVAVAMLVIVIPPIWRNFTPTKAIEKSHRDADVNSKS